MEVFASEWAGGYGCLSPSRERSRGKKEHDPAHKNIKCFGRPKAKASKVSGGRKVNLITSSFGTPELESEGGGNRSRKFAASNHTKPFPGRNGGDMF